MLVIVIIAIEFVYSLSRDTAWWHIIHEMVLFILATNFRHFALVDDIGIQLYSYEVIPFNPYTFQLNESTLFAWTFQIDAKLM